MDALIHVGSRKATCSYHVPSGLIRPLPIHLLQGCNATICRCLLAFVLPKRDPDVKLGSTLTTIHPTALPTECGLS